MKPFKILVVDDDAEIRRILHTLLTNEGYIVAEVSNAKTALAVLDDSFDLVILDIMLPDRDGIAVCSDIRKNSTVPVLFLTAKTDDSFKHIGFATGCDDYLEKPFSASELINRVSALIRRYRIYQGKSRNSDNNIVFKDLCIDEENNLVFQNNTEIHLTNIEYSLLLLFVKNPKKIFTIQNIYESLWQEPFHYSASNTVAVHIKNLRNKLKSSGSAAQYIKNIWGRGYSLDVSETKTP